MKQDWQRLMKMVENEEVVVTRVESAASGIALEGTFELPPLAKLSMEDQVFIATFVGVHGSIKEMERLFGISYPTVKLRLKKITKQLSTLGMLVQEIDECEESILERVARGEISVDDAVKEMKECSP